MLCAHRGFSILEAAFDGGAAFSGATVCPIDSHWENGPWTVKVVRVPSVLGMAAVVMRMACHRVCAVVGDLRIEPSMKSRHKTGLLGAKR